jgi:hypothetical protein
LRWINFDSREKTASIGQQTYLVLRNPNHNDDVRLPI